jgi:DNA-binding response OmpR family regulator
MPIARLGHEEGTEAVTVVAGTELTRIEERLFAVLRVAGGAPVTRAALCRAGWPNDQRVMPQTLYVHLSALRRKLVPEGWRLQSVRGRDAGAYCLIRRQS